MLKTIITVGLFFGYCATLFAGTISAQLSSDAARFMYIGGGERLKFEGGVIYDDSTNYAAMAGVLVSGENIDAPVVASLGLRAYYGEVANDTSNVTSTISVIALGGDLSYSPIELPGFEFGGHYYIAPSTVSSGESEKLTDYGIRVGYQIIPLSLIFIGYQSVEVETSNQGKVTLDDGIMFGMRFTF